MGLLLTSRDIRTFHINRPRLRRDPPDQRPPAHLGLRHHHKRPRRRIHQYVQIAQVIRNHGQPALTSLRQCPFNRRANPQRPHNAPAPAMHPHCTSRSHPHPEQPLAQPAIGDRRQQHRHQQHAAPHRPRRPYHLQQPSRNRAATRGCSVCKSHSVRKSIVLNSRSMAGWLHIFAPTVR